MDEKRKSPKEPDQAQAWFWTKEWQALEAQAQEDIEQGRFTTYKNGEEFLASLDQDD